ncbi:MAG: methyltransferase domain-containing protein [Burkholderiales bacterium]|nr:methyltransferase domain-containing protein [Burkholderiales bacterium]
MSTIPDINLCIIQPSGYVHALGFLDQARFFRYQFRRMGASVSLSKNRLRHDAVNVVFGAHLGFDAQLTQRYTCIFVNLEQLGQGGAQVSENYLKLLAHSAVVDYDADNVSAYTTYIEDVPIVPFLYAPYLKPVNRVPLAERPIDVLFIGSMNDRRSEMLKRIESTGAKVVTFDSPLYGPERDQFIMQAKCVFNAHFYASSRFEQARVSHCLSLGTPVVSERSDHAKPHAAFEDSVFWVRESDLEPFFSTQFATPAFYDAAESALSRFESVDPVEDYADVLAFAAGYVQIHQARRSAEPWKPQRINLGSGKDYKLGWFNIDILDRAQPDLILDLGQPVQWPVQTYTEQGGNILLEPSSVELIYANNVLEHVPDLPQLMTNCLALLKTGGQFLVEVPFEHAATAWQDPTHVRALNEKSWLYYADWFWYLGWFEHRFSVDQFQYLDDGLQECDRGKAAFMRVLLTKVETSLKERNAARVMRPDFCLPDDD